MNGPDIVSHIWDFSLFYMIWHWESQIKVIEFSASMIWPKHIETYIGNHIWDIYDGICDHPARNFRTKSLFSQNCPELCGRILRGKRCIKMSLFLYGNSPEMREHSAKKLRHGNEVIYVRKFCGNERNWRKFCGKKQRHENEFIYIWNSAEMREMRENQWPPTKNSSNLWNIWGGGGIIFHGLEYLIRHEVVFCFIY